MDKVTSVDVDQSILGRMLDYGTVHVIGTGGAPATEADDRRTASSTCTASRRRWRCATPSPRSSAGIRARCGRRSRA